MGIFICKDPIIFPTGKTSPVTEFYRNLDTFLGPQLTQLTHSVSEQYSKHISSTSELTPKYLYFNKLNLAYKSTIHAENRRLSNTLTPEVLRIITDINNDTRR